MKYLTIAVIGLAAACFVHPADAQSTPSAPSQDDQQKRGPSSPTLAPLVSKTVEETNEAQLRIAERPETAERIATFKKNLFDALRRKGFTVEQAMQLTAATSMAPFTGH